MPSNKMLLEGLLFLVGEEGLSLEQLIKALNISAQECLNLLQELESDFQASHRALTLVCFGGLYKLVTKEEVHIVAKQFFENEKTAPLSSSALETLAIIAYKQPITRVEIEEIRGVGCEVMLKRLLAKDLIEEKGRKDSVGRPILYQVTRNFLDLFKLQSLDDLPDFSSIFSQENELFKLGSD